MGILGGILNALIGSAEERTVSRYPQNCGQQNGGQQGQACGSAPGGFPQKQKVYCKWCGTSFPDVRTLVGNTCQRNPEGKGHVLYEGGEKAQYACKFCGKTFRTIGDMSVNKTCEQKTNRRHEPAM
jgi:hypothetical protein